MTTHLDALVALGMTPLEASVYACLLERPSSTGYSIARAVGKPTANTYKALASLEGKGAVTVAGDSRRLYSAVSPEELLEALERRFRDHRDVAARRLSRLEVSRRDDRVHELRTYEQVISRLRRMLGRCHSSAVLDLAAGALESVSDDLAAAAALGADVLVKAYGPVEIEGVTCVTAEEPPRRSLPVCASVDGREMILATLEPGGARVRHAVWCANADLAAAVHRALVAEVHFADVDSRLARGLSIDELEEAFEFYARIRGDAGARTAG
jgi:sugar-specific transcriptional regulator TrmB